MAEKVHFKVDGCCGKPLNCTKSGQLSAACKGAQVNKFRYQDVVDGTKQESKKVVETYPQILPSRQRR